MKNKLKDKVAVITGANRGIGYAIAKALNAEGVTVYDISRSGAQHQEIKKSYIADVNDFSKIAEIMEEINQNEGRIDIFVNNAGFGIAGTAESYTKENIYKQVDTNLSAVMALSSLAVKYLKKTKGRLINISSVGGIIPLPYQSAYSATKAGVEVFSRALANEVKEYGIRVTSIMPGDTKTGFTSARIVENNYQDEKQRKNAEKSIKKIENDEQKGMSADSVAKVAVKVLRRKNPPLRVTVGMGYKILVFLPRIVSTRFVNFIVGKLYCKKAK